LVETPEASPSAGGRSPSFQFSTLPDCGATGPGRLDSRAQSRNDKRLSTSGRWLRVALTGSLIVAAYFSALFLLLLLAEWLLESGRADHLRYLHLVFLFRQDPSIEEILPYLDLVEGLPRILGFCLGFRPVLNVPLASEV